MPGFVITRPLPDGTGEADIEVTDVPGTGIGVSIKAVRRPPSPPAPSGPAFLSGVYYAVANQLQLNASEAVTDSSPFGQGVVYHPEGTSGPYSDLTVTGIANGNGTNRPLYQLNGRSPRDARSVRRRRSLTARTYRGPNPSASSSRSAAAANRSVVTTAAPAPRLPWG